MISSFFLLIIVSGTLALPMNYKYDEGEYRNGNNFDRQEASAANDERAIDHVNNGSYDFYDDLDSCCDEESIHELCCDEVREHDHLKLYAKLK